MRAGLQETIEGAVRRARMMRVDARELMQVLVQIARLQIRDAVAELGRLVRRLSARS